MKYVEAIQHYKRNKLILSEATKFDTLLYRHHCKLLKKDEKEQFNVKIQSHNPSLGTIMIGEVKIPGVNHLTVKFGEKTKLQDFAKLGFSLDFSNPDRNVSERSPGQTIFEWPAGCVQMQYPLITDENTEMYQEKLIHSLSDGNMVMGMIHCYKKDDQWHFVTENDYEEKKNEMPALCFAFKSPIKDMADKEWLDLEALAKEVFDEVKVDSDEMVHEGFKCINSGEDVKGPLYHSRFILNDKEVELNYSEDTVAKYDQHTVNPIIYYRVAKPLKKDAKLPIIDIQKYYLSEPDVVLDAEVIPDIMH